MKDKILLKKEIFEEVKTYGQLQAKRILGKDASNILVDNFLEGDSLFTDIIYKAIELTEKKL